MALSVVRVLELLLWHRSLASVLVVTMWLWQVGWLSLESSSTVRLGWISIVGHLGTMPAILGLVVRIHHVGVGHWVLVVSLHGHSHWRPIVGVWVSVRPMVSIERKLLAHFFHLVMAWHVLILVNRWVWIWHEVVVVGRLNLIHWHSVALILSLALAQLHLIGWNGVCLLHSSLSVLSCIHVVGLVLHISGVVRFLLVLVCLI